METVIEAIYEARPSFVAKAIGYGEALSLAEGLQKLAVKKHMAIVFDGQSIKFLLDSNDLKEAVLESMDFLSLSGLPMTHLDGTSLFNIQEWAFTSQEDVQLMEALGFKKATEQWEFLPS